MAEVKTKRARLHRLREETLASRKRQEDRDIAMAALALALEKGEKIRADKEKQMKEEEAAAEVNISPKISISAQPLKMALHRNPAIDGSRMVIFLHDSKKALF